MTNNVITLRQYPVSGRITTGNDHPRESATTVEDTVPFTIAALPDDPEYELRLKIGTGQTKEASIYLTEEKFANCLHTLQDETKHTMRTQAFYFGFPTQTAQQAEHKSEITPIKFELLNFGGKSSTGLEIEIEPGLRGGAEIQLTPVQYTDIVQTFRFACESSTPIPEQDVSFPHYRITGDGTKEQITLNSA